MDEDRPGEVPAGGGTGRRSGTLLSGISFPAGVAGLWRRLDCLDEITEWRIVIVVAGMEGALFSVIAGQAPGLVADSAQQRARLLCARRGRGEHRQWLWRGMRRAQADPGFRA